MAEVGCEKDGLIYRHDERAVCEVCDPVALNKRIDRLTAERARWEKLVETLVEALGRSRSAWSDLERSLRQAIERGYMMVHAGYLLSAAKHQRSSCDAAFSAAREQMQEKR